MIKILLSLALLLLLSCSGQERGLSGNAYYSSSKPAIALFARDLPVQGCEQKTIKLMDAGVLGGLPLSAWFTVYGTNPMAIIGHTDLPLGWYWNPTMRQSFAVQEGWLDIGGKRYYAQTYLETPGKNAFVPKEDTAQAETWLIRSFSACYNNNHSKIVLQYREKSPIPLTSLSSLPFGYATLLDDFKKRAETVFALQKTSANTQPSRPIPVLNTQFIHENFFGPATAMGSWHLL
ncbi:MAG: DUF4851 domain-containing protein [Desulfovibrionaceae bacterium]|nr:DUF4851 domain-containing protein [Desulfovibrionaceae bacterium]